MRTIYETLRRLIEWTAEPGARTITVYMNIAAGNEATAIEFVRTECGNVLAADGDRLEALAKLVMERLETLPELVEDAGAQGYDGLAFFLAADPPLQEVALLRFPFEDQVLLGRDPFLRQLLYYNEEYEHTLCAAVKEDRAVVGELHIGDLVRTKVVEATGRRAMAEELNVLLTRTVRDLPRVHVILAGEPSERAEVERYLSQDVQRRIIDRIDRFLEPDDRDFLRKIHLCQQRFERSAEAKGVSQLEELKESGGAVAIGLSETLEAINKGMLAKLYIMQAYEQRGWLCDACDYLGVLPTPPACLACGASVSELQLEEHILDQAAACGAEIETVYRSATLVDNGGIGAVIEKD